MKVGFQETKREGDEIDGSREGLIKSTCLDWRENFPPNEANFRRNTGCISRKFNEMGWKIFRQDGYGDLFRASQELIELYFARSEEAIEATEAQYAPYCRTIALRILGNEEDAEECLADVWLRVWNAIPPEKPKYFKLAHSKNGKVQRIK